MCAFRIPALHLEYLKYSVALATLPVCDCVFLLMFVGSPEGGQVPGGACDSVPL